MMVAATGTTLLAITSTSIGHLPERSRGDAALAGVLSQLRQARDLAVNRRRAIQVDFVAPNEVRTTQLDIPNGMTLINQFFLEGNVQFVQFARVPDTPEGFGAATAVDFANETPYFIVEGMLVDGSGTALSGTVFLDLQNEPSSARAVTVFGGTGQARGSFKCCRNVFKPPTTLVFEHDTDFLDMTKQPPATPHITDVNITGFRQIFGTQ